VSFCASCDTLVAVEGVPFCRWCRRRFVALGQGDPAQVGLFEDAVVRPESAGARAAVEIVNMNNIVDQLSKDVSDAGVMIAALPDGDAVIGYQCIVVIRRANGALEAMHAAVAEEQSKGDVGRVVRDKTAESWPA